MGSFLRESAILSGIGMNSVPGVKRSKLLQPAQGNCRHQPVVVSNSDGNILVQEIKC